MAVTLGNAPLGGPFPHWLTSRRDIFVRELRISISIERNEDLSYELFCSHLQMLRVSDWENRCDIQYVDKIRLSAIRNESDENLFSFAT